DLRRRGGDITHCGAVLDDLTVTPAGPVRGDFVMLGSTSVHSTFVCVWSGEPSGDVNGLLVQFSVDLFNNNLTSSNAQDGRIGQPTSPPRTVFACDANTGSRTAIVVLDGRDDLDIVAA